MVPDTGTETLSPEAKTFSPHLGSEVVVNPMNEEIADQTDVAFLPKT